MAKQQASIYEFGPFRLDTRRRLLLREAEPVALPSKAYDALVVLIASGGQVVAREELFKQIWPDSFVEEANLNVCISALRKALGGSGYIVTVPGRGYHFAAGVREVADEGGEVALTRRTRTHIVIREEEPLQERALAVLPFRPFGFGDGGSYVGVGLADTLITQLSNVSQIIVRPTGVIMKYAGAEQDTLAIGQALRVGWVLEGSIRKVDGRVRVTAQLVGVREGRTLWADKFDGPFADIFAIEDRVSEQIANALQIKLTGGEHRRLLKRHTENTEAYQAYLQGRYHWNTGAFDGVTRSLECFRRAVEADPDYALAYVGIADFYSLVVVFDVSPQEAFPKAKAAALRALELDEGLAEAHTALAGILMEYDWDIEGAKQSFRRALELNPNLALARARYAQCLAAAGDPQALEEVKRMQALEPVSPFINASASHVHYFLRQYDRVIAECQKWLAVEPNIFTARNLLGLAYEAKGMYAAALEEYQQVPSADDSPTLLARLGYIYAKLGQRKKAEAILKELRRQAAQRYVSGFLIAQIYIGMGKTDEVFACLEQAYAARDFRLIYLRALQHGPRFVHLRSDPRFQDLLARIGFSP